MAPYAPSFDCYASPPAGNNACNKEEVIFSLTERLREREAEIHHLKQDKSELENQLVLRGNPIKLDVAYEELLAHLKKREEDFRKESNRQDRRQRDLERENRKLKDRVHTSRKRTDVLEKNTSVIDKETQDELDQLRQRLHVAMGENQEKDQEIDVLEDVVERLTVEIKHNRKREDDDKVLLSRLAERVDNYKQDQDELEGANEELQKRVETQRHLLKAKEVEIEQMETLRNQMEDELTDDLGRMRARTEEIVDYLRVALEEREEEIHLLHGQCERYEDIIDEAEYVTYEQRAALQAKRKEIEDMNVAIENVQNGGILGTLDKMCSFKNVYASATSQNGGSR